MKPTDASKLIISTLSDKASVKQVVFNNTREVMGCIRDVCRQLVESYNKEFRKMGNDPFFHFEERGIFESELRIADDILIFDMHTNIFSFDKEHNIWDSTYVSKNELNSFCGIINIYNFLADSFKYNRDDDLGYLIARIFVNRERHYFVEGKRQLGFLYNDFEHAVCNNAAIRNIIESALLYSLDFDLLVPPYDNVKITSVENVKKKNVKQKTGKRLGFMFYTDDNRT